MTWRRGEDDMKEGGEGKGKEMTIGRGKKGKVEG